MGSMNEFAIYIVKYAFSLSVIYLYNNIVLSMLYAEICPKVRRQRGVHYAF
jgi:hypothetical protein